MFEEWKYRPYPLLAKNVRTFLLFVLYSLVLKLIYRRQRWHQLLGTRLRSPVLNA